MQSIVNLSKTALNESRSLIVTVSAFASLIERDAAKLIAAAAPAIMAEAIEKAKSFLFIKIPPRIFSVTKS